MAETIEDRQDAEAVADSLLRLLRLDTPRLPLKRIRRLANLLGRWASAELKAESLARKTEERK